MEVSLVPVEYIESVWPSIESYMEKVAKFTYGRFKADDIKNDLQTKQQQLWVAFDNQDFYGAVVSEIIVYPQMTTLCVHFLSGKEFDLWRDDMLALVQRFARDSGCKLIESSGRVGWKKMWENYGYKPRFVFYELPIGE